MKDMTGKFAALWFLLPFALPLPAMAQSLADIEAEILALKECVELSSLPDFHKAEHMLSSGKNVAVFEQSDFERSAFSTVDSFIENIGEFLDSSPFFCDRKKLLMDPYDLSEWEKEGIRKISNEYFKNGGNNFHLAAHGLVAPDGSSSGIRIGGEDLNAEETAELIIKSMGGVNHVLLNAAHEPFTVVLHCCNSGKGEDSFAARLSLALEEYLDDVAVIAAPDIVYCTEDEDGNYTERIASAESIDKGSFEQDALNWLVFKSGDMVMTGTKDYGTTVAEYIKDKL